MDTWTKAEPGSAVTITSSDELKSAVTAGGNYYLPYNEAGYSMGTAKPAGNPIFTPRLLLGLAQGILTQCKGPRSTQGEDDKLRFALDQHGDDGPADLCFPHMAV